MAEKTEVNEKKPAKTTRQKRVKTEKETKTEPVEEKSLTRAEKVKRQKDVIKELLIIRDYKWNELLDTATKLYGERHADEQNESNDLKGRIGSAFDLLEKEGKAKFNKPTGMCSWTEEKPAEAKSEPKKRGRKKAEPKAEIKAEEVKESKEGGETKTTEKAVLPVESVPAPAEAAEKPVKRGRAAKKEALNEPAEKAEPKKRGRKKAEPKVEAKAEEVKEPKEGVETKTAEKAVLPVESVPAPAEAAEKPEKKTEEAAITEKSALPEKNEKAEGAAKVEEAEKTVPVFDLSLLLGGKTEKKAQEKREEKPAEEKREQKFELPQAKAAIREERKQEQKKTVLPEFAFLGNAGAKARESAPAPVQAPVQRENREEKPVKTEAKAEVKTEEKKAPAPTRELKAEALPEQKSAPKTAVKAETKAALPQNTGRGRNSRGGVNGGSSPRSSAPKTEEEKLKDAFLKRLRALGGEYFEYYSVYLLERYSLKNGRRLEGLKISGGDMDGGIDGEIVLTDKFGFRETIYIQCKNWDPSKGDTEKWVVGETLLQQFIGAVACRQAREGKRKARGIFVTTSYFTDGAREILDSMSADFIGYDGNDVFETAKECGFGIVQKDGKWALDEKLLAGGKAFFELM